MRTAQAILRLAHKFSPRRLETACARALRFDEIGYGSVKRILTKGLDLVTVPAASPPAETQPLLFARPWTDFFVKA